MLNGDAFRANSVIEPGSTVKAASRIVEIVLRPGSLPWRMSLGDDAVALIKERIEKLGREADEWSELGMGLSRDK